SLVTEGEGNDTVWGSDYADLILGGAGKDVINAAGGFDLIYGGKGNDTIDPGTGVNIAFGGEDDDTITVPADSTDPNILFGDDLKFSGGWLPGALRTFLLDLFSLKLTLPFSLGLRTVGTGNDTIRGGAGNNII